VFVFNYSTNIRKITDIKKSRGNYFAFILPYYPTSILYNSDWVAVGPALYGAPMVHCSCCPVGILVGREHTSLYYSWILAFVSADLLGSFSRPAPGARHGSGPWPLPHARASGKLVGHCGPLVDRGPWRARLDKTL
jgi:hypothetical protein